MYVITADQVDSRESDDLVESALDQLSTRDLDLVLPAERTVGDELQLLLARAADTLDVILALTRTGQWSVGCGVGDVREPLPASIREASGTAFVAARDAIERAKKSPTRFALTHARDPAAGNDAEALVDLMLALRARRSGGGWDVHDLLETGITQAEAAGRLGISPQAVSGRARAADLKIEYAARAPLTRLLENLATVETLNEGD